MKLPKRLQPLVEDGLIDDVVSQLMSGKEATVYIVRCGSEQRCAKVYKEAAKRSFKKAAQYQEGRKVRNSRRARAMEKGSKFGRKQLEETWQNAEVDALYRLASAGVRVPKPYHFVDGILVMELVTDADGNPAQCLAEVTIGPIEAKTILTKLLSSVVKMLCSGIVHGDLSAYNVLMGHDGPVLIDFPQAIDSAANQNARKLLLFA